MFCSLVRSRRSKFLCSRVLTLLAIRQTAANTISTNPSPSSCPTNGSQHHQFQSVSLALSGERQPTSSAPIPSPSSCPSNGSRHHQQQSLSLFFPIKRQPTSSALTPFPSSLSLKRQPTPSAAIPSPSPCTSNGSQHHQHYSNTLAPRLFPRLPPDAGTGAAVVSGETREPWLGLICWPEEWRHRLLAPRWRR